jgi:phosphatidylserine/phosphatidylglycerophosphate/cardiolipin synthase-like enzyme
MKRSLSRVLFAAVSMVAILASAPAIAGRNTLTELGQDLIAATRGSTAHEAPAGLQLESAFSPRGGGVQLVEKAIGSARTEIRMLAYGFTNPDVARALIAARKRGVDVKVAVDYKANVGEDRSGKGKAALNLLVNAGIPVRVVSVYPIHHDKTQVIDRKTVQTGSFNYTAAAEKSNSENVLVVWNEPKLAASYLRQWERNWNQGRDYKSSY